MYSFYEGKSLLGNAKSAVTPGFYSITVPAAEAEGAACQETLTRLHAPASDTGERHQLSCHRSLSYLPAAPNTMSQFGPSAQQTSSSRSQSIFWWGKSSKRLTELPIPDISYTETPISPYTSVRFNPKKSSAGQTHCCSVAQLCLTLCVSMDCNMPGFPVLHYLLKLAQIHVHWGGDVVQPSHSPSSPSPVRTVAYCLITQLT